MKQRIGFIAMIVFLVALTLVLFSCCFNVEGINEETVQKEEFLPPLTVTFSHFEMCIPQQEQEELDEPLFEKEEPQEKQGVVFELTAYCPCEKCCGKWAKNRPVDENGELIVIGSTGTRLTAGKSIAVDPKVIPYGSIVIIDGKEYTAEDCGGAIKGNRIDVFFDDHEDALDFGRQTKTVFLED